MTGFHNIRNRGILAVLVLTVTAAEFPVRAQDTRAITAGIDALAQATGSQPSNPKGAPSTNSQTATFHSDAVFQFSPSGEFVTAENAAIFAKVLDPGDEMLGATLQPVGDALRAQLDIPAGQGLLIASLRTDGPSAQAGLRQNDILLALAGKPLAAADDITKQLKNAGESPVKLQILRSGKPVTIQVRPIYRVSLGPVQDRKVEYYIGVSINPVDDALRAQLNLTADQGVIITEVKPGSPAEKVGVKMHDIVLEMAGKPIDKPETLASQVQANRDNPTTMKVMRAGKAIDMVVTGATRQVNVDGNASQEALRLWYLTLDDRARSNAARYLLGRTLQAPALQAPASNQDLGQRLDQVERELKALRRIGAVEKELRDLHKAIEKISESLKAARGNKGD
jgi:membrane-associated protease RseP (regulator of RpoE activity)